MIRPDMNMKLNQHLLITLGLCLSMAATLGAARNPLNPAVTRYAYIPAVSNTNIQTFGANNTAFTFGASRYMSTTNINTLKNLGCAQGKATPAATSTLVILDFGQPAYDAPTLSYGVYIFGSYAFRSVSDIAAASEAYLNQFYLCSPAGAYLYLVVGTVNYGSGVTREHGAAWSTMINNIAAWIVDPPSIASKVTILGGNDMEPSFGGRAQTRAWVDGYTSVFTNTSYLYNYGSCDGCPYSSCPSCTPNNYWSIEDVWYVSWGALPAYPVPEIYLTNGVHADQWYRMSLYGYTNHGQAFAFKGTLTQWQACQTNGPCQYLDNTPNAGWSQLYTKINNDLRTQKTLGPGSDITWSNSN